MKRAKQTMAPLLGAQLLCAVVLSILGPALAAAQEFPSQTRGLGANTAYHVGDIDSVNLFNGNLSLSIPIGPRYPVGGSLSYGLTLSYNSNAWDLEDGSCSDGQGNNVSFQFSVPDPESNAGLGWHLTLGHFRTVDGVGPGAPPRVGSWTYVSPDGGQRKFFSELHPGTAQATGVLYTHDGTYLRGKEAPAASCPAPPAGALGFCRTVEFPDGNEHVFFDLGTTAEPNWRVTLMRDRFGNQVEIAYGDFDWTLTDSHGRQQVVRFDPGGVPRGWKKIKSIEVTAFDPVPGTAGAEAEYLFTYEQASIERHRYDPLVADAQCSDPPASQVVVDLPVRIRQPDASHYSMTYDHAETSQGMGYVSGSKSGALRQLRIPTGALYNWDYDNLSYLFFYSVPPDLEPERFGANANYGVIKKEIFDDDGTTSLGRWLYQPAQGPFGTGSSDPPCYHTNKVTDPADNWTVHYFHVADFPFKHRNSAPFTLCAVDSGDPPSSPEGPYLSQEMFEDNGTTEGSRRRSVWLDFEDDGPLANGGNGSEIRYRLRRTVYHDDNDYRVDVAYSDHDGLGHFRQEVRTSTFPEGRNTRTVSTRFNPGSGTLGGPNPSFVLPPVGEPWVLNTYDLHQVTEGVVDDDHRATTDFCFDTDTGFLEGRRQRNPAGGPDSDVLTRFTPDGSGNVGEERIWGGDSQPEDSLPAGCSTEPGGEPQYHLDHTFAGGLLAESSFLDRQGSRFLRIVDNTIDVPSGLVRSRRDPAGFETTFTYDVMGRKLTEVPERGAWTQQVYTYPRPANPDAELEVELRRCVEGASGCQAAGNQISRRRFLFDRRARLIQEWRQLPTEVGSDEVSRTFEYDGLGRQTKVTEWGRPNDFTQYSSFDRFGRPGTIRRPDQTETTWVYTGDRITRRTSKVAGLAGELDSVAQEIRDAKGRVIRVREQSGADGAFVDTTYQYDEGNRLIEVCSNEIGGSCGQVRSFDYDDRGFLRSEIHPEIGAAGYGSYSYTYDARGNVLRRALSGTSAFTQGFRYDTAGRVVQVRDANDRMLKEFFYGRENGTNPTDLREGKLVQAKRHNYVLADASAATESDIVVTEHFAYRGEAGRLSDVLLRSTDGVGFDLEVQAYDDLGNITRLGYPACLYHLCSSSDRLELVKNYQFGRLTSVSEFVSSVTYHPNGRVAKIAHDNGVTDWREQPSSGWPRLSRIRTVHGGSDLRDSGLYAYDGSGNIREIGDERFFYDPVSRLIQGTVDAGSQGFLTRNYAYDAYGNLTSITGANNPIGALSPSPSTNRLPSFRAGYDEAGNIEHLAIGFDYKFDPFNQMKLLDGSGRRSSYLYNARDERVATLDLLSGTGQQVWTPRGTGNEVLSRFVLDGSSLDWVKDYVHGGNLKVATVQPGDTGEVKNHLHADHLGSTRVITDPAAIEVSRLSYFPFGQNVANPGPGTEELQFTGQERDDNGPGLLGDLDYFHARYFSGYLGRFLSVDPVLGTAENPVSWNRYAYSFNRPLHLVDLDGRQPEGAEVAEATVATGIRVSIFFMKNVHPVVRFGSLGATLGSYANLAFEYFAGESPGRFFVPDLGPGPEVPPFRELRSKILAGREIEQIRSNLEKFEGLFAQAGGLEEAGDITPEQADELREEALQVIEVQLMRLRQLDEQFGGLDDLVEFIDDPPGTS